MKTVVITGGSDGLGKALAEKLAPTHAVVILARNKAALQQVAKQAGCDYLVCDVRDAKQVENAFASIAATHGHIDALINNAGVIVNGELTETSYADIENTLTTNTLGAIYVAKAALQNMKAHKKGLIVNVVSQSGLSAKAGRSVYNASKWALAGFTKALQQEAVEYGVRVTGFYPGTIKTDLFAKANIQMNGLSLTTEQVVTAIEFILLAPDHVLIPELGIKHIGN